MAGTIFYSSCAAGGLIEARSKIYNQETRDSDSYLWLYKKMATATAQAGGITLGTLTGTGFPSRTNKNSVYTTTNTSPGNNVRNLIPKPHLVSIKTSYAGDFGSVQKCEIAFTVYSLDQLNQCQGFFTINAAVFASWGWTNAGSAGEGDVSFSGNVVNFSWSINSTGGADCTCSAIGKGVNTLSINANLPAKDQTKTYKSGLNELPVTSVLEKLKYWVASDPAPTIGNPIQVMEAGSTGFVGVIEASDAFKKPALDPPLLDPNTKLPVVDESALKKYYYVSLGLIIHEFNQSLKAYTSTNTQLVIDPNNGGLCQLPSLASFASANPIECIFPGMSKYTSSDPVNPGGPMEFDGSLSGNFSAGGVTNVGYIMIEIEYLQEVMKSLGGATDKGERSPSKTLNDFFKKIFTMIDSNSGGAIKLSTVVNSKKTNQVLIVETQYIPGDITPVPIPSITQKSITRSMSLTAKVPSELQVVASVAATSGGGNVHSTALKPFTGATVINNNATNTNTTSTNTTPGQFTGTPKVTGPTNLNKPTGGTAVIDATTKEERALHAQEAALSAQQQVEIDKENFANFLLNTNPLLVVYLMGPKAEYVTAARSYLRKAIKPESAGIVFPLDFSFTIDGIAGIKFGDAVTTNYMPGLYKKKSTRCSFTVLSVEHNVSGNDWTTSCTTVFRMRP